jgi:hypothetical protein
LIKLGGPLFVYEIKSSNKNKTTFEYDAEKLRSEVRQILVEIRLYLIENNVDKKIVREIDLLLVNFNADTTSINITVDELKRTCKNEGLPVVFYKKLEKLTLHVEV